MLVNKRKRDIDLNIKERTEQSEKTSASCAEPGSLILVIARVKLKHHSQKLHTSLWRKIVQYNLCCEA